MYIIIGGRGRLGSCLAKMTSAQVHHVDHTACSEWWRPDSKKNIVKYFEERNLTQGTVLITAGVLDPSRSASEHECVNYLLPKHVIESANSLGLRTITFGTVMENLIGDKTQNPYIMSKLRLSHFVQECPANHIAALHVRLHTLYGGASPPHSFMFLGQLLNAIHNRTDFKMTHGEQLREYHHIDDEARAIFHLAQTKLTGVMQLNHGKPEKLKDIAHHVLNAFEQLPLLRLNALKPPMHENYDAFFEPGPYIKEMVFRKTLPGIVDYLKVFVAESRLESSAIY